MVKRICILRKTVGQKDGFAWEKASELKSEKVC
jgi:hypothetical protein